MEKPAAAKGFLRIWRAFGYSFNGIKTCFREEEAFRQESILFIALLPILVILPISALAKIVLLMVNVFVLIVELLNSAIEAVVDKVSPEFHQLAKHAKDMGSAAVLLALGLAGTTWVTILYGIVCKP